MIRENVAELKRMYVVPEFQGKKIGQALLEELFTTAINFGAIDMWTKAPRMPESAPEEPISGAISWGLKPIQKKAEKIPLDIYNSKNLIKDIRRATAVPNARRKKIFKSKWYISEWMYA